MPFIGAADRDPSQFPTPIAWISAARQPPHRLRLGHSLRLGAPGAWKGRSPSTRSCGGSPARARRRRAQISPSLPQRAEGPPSDILMAPTNGEQRETTNRSAASVLNNTIRARRAPGVRRGPVRQLPALQPGWRHAGPGSVGWYRRDALRRAGLRKGMRLLDVTAGTGLMTRGGVDRREEQRRERRSESGHARRRRRRSPRRWWAEPRPLPFRGDRFDMLSMGFALPRARPGIAFREYFRILKPGGRIILLETPRRGRRGSSWFVKTHFQRVLPWMARIAFRNEPTARKVLLGHDDQCVPPGRSSTC